MEDTKTPALVFSNKTYDVVKFFAQILLPGLGTLYFALAGIWDLPAAEKVIGTITAVDVFLGLLLGLSSSAYKNSDVPYDGDVIAKTNEDGSKTLRMALDLAPEELLEKDSVTFKVKSDTFEV